MKILVKIPVSTFSGYGNDGIGLTRALMRWGCDVRLDPTVVQPPIPEDLAMLLTKPLEAPFDLILTHLDPGALEATVEQSRATTAHVAWTMWEWDNLSNLPGRSKFPKKTKYFDAIYAYDPVSEQAVKSLYKGQVPVVQGGYEPNKWQEVERDWFSERFGFFMIGALNSRKNPFAALEAFNELKHEYPEEFAPAELHLKTNLPGLSKAMEDVYDKVRIHYDVWPTDVVKKFYEKQHVLLAPSWGEGKNMPALEFQSTGGVVIGTNFGGHTMWMHPSYSFPVDYDLVSNTQFPEAHNAAINIADLKAKMLWAFRNRGEVREMGHRAAQIIPKLCSWDAAVERFFQKLPEAIPDGRGEQLRQLAMAARWGDHYGNG